ncbi:MAG: oxidoreductase, partial [Gemmatimonadota bacterium]|nr:oxidoreductase [Gemmatimonadota bacterium]
RWLGQRRRVVDSGKRGAAAYRLYWFLVIDVALHLAIKFTACVAKSRSLVTFLYRRILPLLVFPRWTVTDRSDRQLTMRHELFRHFELELFVQRRDLPGALELVRETLVAAGSSTADVPPGILAQAEAAGRSAELKRLSGTYQHHYPICIRRVLPEDALLSMASSVGRPEDDWYAISLITYRSPREPFMQTARFLADVTHTLHGARIHWGKWFPHSGAQVEAAYPALEAFRDHCRGADPAGVFRNSFIEQTLFEEPTAGRAQSGRPPSA